MTRHVRDFRSIWLGATALLALPAMLLAEAAAPVYSDRIQQIEFAIPGSKPGTTTKAVVALPADYHTPEAAGMRYPVVYLLHGYSGNQEDWHRHTAGTDRALDVLAERYRVIIVMPNGKYNTWYLDSVPEGKDSADYQWETVITKHLIPEIDRKYRTWADPAGRGITGLSMGGHGSVFLCARHPELFSACGTMSGVMDLRPFKDNYELTERLGAFDKHPDRWLGSSGIGLADRFAGRKVGILIDCGLEDKAFIGGNQELHRKLLDLNVPHDYFERPGAHTWPYWINALPYHLQFMSDRLKPAGKPA